MPISHIANASGTKINPATINGINLPVFDYVSQSIVDETCTYTYKTGGSGGSTVATVTVVYTDATLSTIVSVTKT